jgi:hypothetical protein
MSSRDEYLAYLATYSLREADVLPLVNIPAERKEEFGYELQFLYVTGKITKEERDQWDKWSVSLFNCNDLIVHIHDRLKNDLRQAGGVLPWIYVCRCSTKKVHERRA